MQRIRIAALGTIAVAALAPAAALAAGTTSHAQGFTTKTVACGISTVTPSHQLLCSAKGIPKPKGQNDGDPFVTMGRTGKPKLVLISQDSFGSDKFASLKAGAKWSLDGYACTIGTSTATCKNSSGHGFTIGGRYKSF